MTKNSYLIASILVFLSAGLVILTYWDVITGPHLADLLVTVFSAICLAGLGLIILRRNSWMKWLLLLIMIFEMLNLAEVIRFRTTLKLILTIIQFILLFGAMMLLFMTKDMKEQEHETVHIPDA
jgi:hypothetical protein